MNFEYQKKLEDYVNSMNSITKIDHVTVRNGMTCKFYTEEFKAMAVRAVRSGYGMCNLGRKLDVYPLTIVNWLKSPKYDYIKSLDESDTSPVQPELKFEKATSDTNITVESGSFKITIPKGFDFNNLGLVLKAVRQVC